MKRTILQYSFYIMLTIVSLILLVGAAEQPIATITELEGTVVVSLQGQDAIVATIGIELKQGDVIRTQDGATVVLTLSDESVFQLGEDTELDLAILAQDSETEARTSVVKLGWGKIRAFLSPDHQEEGSSFTIETPNAMAGVKFSQPYVEVGYDPETDTSMVAAHTVWVVVTNRRTGERREFEPRHQVKIERQKPMEGSRMSSERQTIFEKMPAAPDNLPPKAPDSQVPPGQQPPLQGQQQPPPASGQQPQVQGEQPPNPDAQQENRPAPENQQEKPERKAPPERENKSKERKSDRGRK